ncbi:MAG: hypothetical protein ABH844_04370 [Candidatus Omnitrophota bacterium]
MRLPRALMVAWIFLTFAVDSHALLVSQTAKAESEKKQSFGANSSDVCSESVELKLLDEYLNRKIKNILAAIEGLSERFSDIEQKLADLNLSINKIMEKIDGVINKPHQEVKMEFR